MPLLTTVFQCFSMKSSLKEFSFSSKERDERGLPSMVNDEQTVNHCGNDLQVKQECFLLLIIIIIYEEISPVEQELMYTSSEKIHRSTKKNKRTLSNISDTFVLHHSFDANEMFLVIKSHC